MNYIVLDLEATCWRDKRMTQSEIIEIGAVCVSEELDSLGEYCGFVQPMLAPILSPFCKELTSIRQDQVSSAPLFPESLQLFQDWIASFGEEYYLCSWGYYDKSQFKKDCQLHELPTAWLKNHISIKHQYAKVHNIAPIGMRTALRREGFRLDGTHHRGIDDARNITKVFKANFEFFEFS